MSIAEKFVSMEYGPAPEDSKEAVTWLERHGRRFRLFIDGAWQAPAREEYSTRSIPRMVKSLPAWRKGVRLTSMLQFAQHKLLPPNGVH